MNKLTFKTLFFLLLWQLMPNQILAQAPGVGSCPSVDAGADVNICKGNSTTLSASLITTNRTTSYGVASIPYLPYPNTGGVSVLGGTDDVWSGVKSIGFNFCYFGNTYKNCVIGSNGQLSFNTGLANTTDNFIVNHTLPSTANMPGNTIAAAFRDTDPDSGSKISYRVFGTAPCRAFVVNWTSLPLYNPRGGNCNALPRSTYQLVLYESTNFIDVYIQNSTACAAWQEGHGIIGIQNANASSAVCPAFRNNTAWTAVNEAWRFSPTGTPSFTFKWFATATPGTTLGTNPNSLTVSPTVTTSYTAQMILTNCNGSTLVRTDTVVVNVASPSAAFTPLLPSQCLKGNSFSFTSSSGPGVTHLWNFPGAIPNTSTAANPTGVSYLAPGTYTVTHTVTTPPTANTPLGCKDVQTTQVTVFPSPTTPSINPPVSLPICAGTTVTLMASGGGPGVTYQWSTVPVTPVQNGQTINVHPAVTTTYTVVAINSNLCRSLPATTTIVVRPSPNANFTVPANQCFTNNNSFTFTNTGNSGIGFTQSWTFPGGTPNASNAINPPVVHYNLPGTYTITHTVTNAIGCKKVVQQTVTVYPLPTIAITKGITQTCPTFSTTLTASGAVSYSWNTTPVQTTAAITVNPTTSTTYTVTGTDANANGCTNTASFNVVPAPCVVLPAECEETKWPVQAGFSGDIAFGDSVVTDKNGNVYVSGVFSNQVTFGTQTITAPQPNQYYFYLVRYDNCGDVRWVAYGSVEGPGNNHKIKIYLDVDPLGKSVYISSPLITDLKVVDGTGSVQPVQPRTGPNSFIIKFDAVTGAQQRSVLVNYDADFEPITVNSNGLYQKNHNKIYHYDFNLNSIGLPYDLTNLCSSINTNCIDSDANGNIYVAGSFQGTLATTTPVIAIANTELYVMKLDSNLNVLYAQKGGANSSDINVETNDMYINGNALYVTGYYSTGTNNTASPFSQGTASAGTVVGDGDGQNDGFALKFNLSSSPATLNWAFKTLNEYTTAIGSNDTNGYLGFDSLSGGNNLIQHFNSSTGAIITSSTTATSGIANDIHFNTIENAFFMTGVFVDTIQLGSSSLTVFGQGDMFIGRLKSGLGSGDFYKQSSAGIGETLTNDIFNFYPNPVTDHSTIDFTLENVQDVKISVIDITGKTIKTIGESVYTKGNHKLDIDMSDLQCGFYFVRFNANNKIIDKKLIKL